MKTSTHRRMLLMLFACLWLHAPQATAGPGDAPPLPTGSDTGESFGGHYLFIDLVGSCPGFENAGLPYAVDYRSRNRYRSSIGGAKNLKGKIKVKKKPIQEFGEEVFLAEFKLNAKGERKMKKWLTGLVRECTGDPKAKLKIKELRYEIKTQEIGGEVDWFRHPTLEVEGTVKTRGEKGSVSLDG